MVRHVRVLHVCAVEAEARGLSHPQEALITGVGPASAAARLARRLACGPAVDLVVVSGVTGVLPLSPREGASRGVHGDPARLDFPLTVGDGVLVRRAAMVDEGVLMPAGFVSLSGLGLSATAIGRSHDRLRGALAAALAVREVDCATVSTGSGTDRSALAVANRLAETLSSDDPRPGIETMESAALALACADAGVPWIEVRVISNRTGDRDRSGWDLHGALHTLVELRERVIDHLQTLSGVLTEP